MVPWWDDAACYGHPPELWDTAGRGSREYRAFREHAAKTICATCPVKDPCLADAIEWESSDLRRLATIRGGLNPPERHSLATQTMKGWTQ